MLTGDCRQATSSPHQNAAESGGVVSKAPGGLGLEAEF